MAHWHGVVVSSRHGASLRCHFLPGSLRRPRRLRRRGPMPRRYRQRRTHRGDRFLVLVACRALVLRDGGVGRVAKGGGRLRPVPRPNQKRQLTRSTRQQDQQRHGVALIGQTHPIGESRRQRHGALVQGDGHVHHRPAGRVDDQVVRRRRQRGDIKPPTTRPTASASACEPTSCAGRRGPRFAYRPCGQPDHAALVGQPPS